MLSVAHESEEFLWAWLENWPMNLEDGWIESHILVQSCVYAHNFISKSEQPEDNFLVSFSQPG